MKNNKGFTLVELLAVLLIISIIAAIGIPKTYRYVQTKQAKEATILQDKLVNAAKIHFAKEGIDSINNTSSVPISDLITEGLITELPSGCDPNGKIEISIDQADNIITYKFSGTAKPGETCVSDGKYTN